MNMGNAGKVKHFFPFSFSLQSLTEMLLRIFSCLRPLTLKLFLLYSAFMLLSSPPPPKKLHSCFPLPLSWLGTGGDGSLEWDTSSLSLSV